jgi:hypothetical protein
MDVGVNNNNFSGMPESAKRASKFYLILIQGVFAKLQTQTVACVASNCPNRKVWGFLHPLAKFMDR